MSRAHRQGARGSRCIALAAVIYLSAVSARPSTDLNQSPSRSQLLTNPRSFQRAQYIDGVYGNKICRFSEQSFR